MSKIKNVKPDEITTHNNDKAREFFEHEKAAYIKRTGEIVWAEYRPTKEPKPNLINKETRDDDN
jgi:hypothetical protein